MSLANISPAQRQIAGSSYFEQVLTKFSPKLLRAGPMNDAPASRSHCISQPTLPSLLAIARHKAV